MSSLKINNQSTNNKIAFKQNKLGLSFSLINDYFLEINQIINLEQNNAKKKQEFINLDRIKTRIAGWQAGLKVNNKNQLSQAVSFEIDTLTNHLLALVKIGIDNDHYKFNRNQTIKYLNDSIKILHQFYLGNNNKAKNYSDNLIKRINQAYTNQIISNNEYQLANRIVNFTKVITPIILELQIASKTNEKNQYYNSYLKLINNILTYDNITEKLGLIDSQIDSLLVLIGNNFKYNFNRHFNIKIANYTKIIPIISKIRQGFKLSSADEQRISALYEASNNDNRTKKGINKIQTNKKDKSQQIKADNPSQATNYSTRFLSQAININQLISQWINTPDFIKANLLKINKEKIKFTLPNQSISSLVGKTSLNIDQLFCEKKEFNKELIALFSEEEMGNKSDEKMETYNKLYDRLKSKFSGTNYIDNFIERNSSKEEMRIYSDKIFYKGGKDEIKKETSKRKKSSNQKEGQSGSSGEINKDQNKSKQPNGDANNGAGYDNVNSGHSTRQDAIQTASSSIRQSASPVERQTANSGITNAQQDGNANNGAGNDNINSGHSTRQDAIQTASSSIRQSASPVERQTANSGITNAQQDGNANNGAGNDNVNNGAGNDNTNNGAGNDNINSGHSTRQDAIQTASSSIRQSASPVERQTANSGITNAQQDGNANNGAGNDNTNNGAGNDNINSGHSTRQDAIQTASSSIRQSASPVERQTANSGITNAQQDGNANNGAGNDNTNNGAGNDNINSGHSTRQDAIQTASSSIRQSASPVERQTANSGITNAQQDGDANNGASNDNTNNGAGNGNTNNGAGNDNINSGAGNGNANNGAGNGNANNGASNDNTNNGAGNGNANNGAGNGNTNNGASNDNVTSGSSYSQHSESWCNDFNSVTNKINAILKNENLLFDNNSHSDLPLDFDHQNLPLNLLNNSQNCENYSIFSFVKHCLAKKLKNKPLFLTKSYLPNQFWQFLADLQLYLNQKAAKNPIHYFTAFHGQHLQSITNWNSPFYNEINRRSILLGFNNLDYSNFNLLTNIEVYSLKNFFNNLNIEKQLNFIRSLYEHCPFLNIISQIKSIIPALAWGLIIFKNQQNWHPEFSNPNYLDFNPFFDNRSFNYSYPQIYASQLLTGYKRILNHNKPIDFNWTIPLFNFNQLMVLPKFVDYQFLKNGLLMLYFSQAVNLSEQDLILATSSFNCILTQLTNFYS